MLYVYRLNTPKMKKIYIFSLALMLSSSLTAQDSLYSKVYDNGVGYKVEALAVAPNDHVIQVGSTDFDYAAFTYTDSLGNVISASKYLIDSEPANGFSFTEAVVTSGNEYFVSGGVLLQGFSANVGVVAKLDNLGTVIWSKGVFTPAPGFFKCTDIIESAEQTLWIVGSDEQTGETAIVEFDTDGVQLASFSFKITGERLEIQDMKELGDTLIFTGTVYATSGSTKGIVFATEKDGTFLWSNTVNDTQLYETELNENSIWSAGKLNLSEPAILTLSHSGTIRSLNTYNNVGIGEIEDLDLAKIYDSTLAITLGNFSLSKLIVTRVNSSDVSRFHVENNATDVVSRENYGLYVSGYGPNIGLKSFFADPHGNMIRIDSAITDMSCVSGDGSSSVSSVTPVDAPISLTTMSAATFSDLYITQVPATLTEIIGCVDYYSGIDELNQAMISIFPNPGNGQVQVANPKGLRGKLEIQNTSGETVFKTNITSSEQTLDLNHLPAGIYFFQFKNQADSTQISSGKLIIL